MPFKWLSKLSKFFSRIPYTSLAYGIRKPCYHCTYQKHDDILLISKQKEVRIIMYGDGKVYARRGDCIGYIKCGKCFEAVKDNSKFSCYWVKI